MGFCLRLVGVSLLPNEFLFPDSLDYHAIAWHLLNGKGFMLYPGAEAVRAPLYPMFLAGLYQIGLELYGVRVVQAVIGGLLPLLQYQILREMESSRSTALWAAALVALDPLQIMFCGLVLTETLFTFLLLCASYALLRAWHMHRWKLAFVAGVLWGGCALMRSSALAYVPLFIGLLIYLGRRRSLALVLSLGVAFMLALLPWSLRNAYLFGQFVPVTTKAGVDLYEALGPGATGGPRVELMQVPSRAQELPEALSDRYLRKEALRYAWDHPWQTLKLAAIKGGRFWNPGFNDPKYRALSIHYLVIAFGLPVYGAALLGLLWVRFPVRWLVIFPILYFTLVHLVFIGSVRYRVPIMPFVEIAAAWGISRIWSRMQEARKFL